MRHVWITDVEFVWALDEFLKRYQFDFPKESIPRPRTEDVYRAASAVTAVNHPVFGRRRFRTLSQKLAALTYELCKQHFFLNGNKRIAFFFLIYVLVLNDKEINLPTFEERADLMKWIAESDPLDRRRVLNELSELIRHKMRPHVAGSH